MPVGRTRMPAAGRAARVPTAASGRGDRVPTGRRWAWVPTGRRRGPTRGRDPRRLPSARVREQATGRGVSRRRLAEAGQDDATGADPMAMCLVRGAHRPPGGGGLLRFTRSPADCRATNMAMERTRADAQELVDGIDAVLRVLPA